MSSSEIAGLFIRETPEPPPDYAPRVDDLIEIWVDRASAAVETWRAGRDRVGSEPPWEFRELCEAAYDALASWSGLIRIRPDLRPLCDDTFAELRALIRKDREALVRAAERLPDPAGWMEEMREWEQEAESPGIDHVYASRRARELYCDLDDAELVAWALDRLLPGSGRRLAEELEPCLRRATDEAWRFYPASTYLRRVAESMDPGLADRDPDLALTQVKLLATLDAFDRALAEEPANLALSAEELKLLGSHALSPSAAATPWEERLRHFIDALSEEWKRIVSTPPPWPVHAPIHSTGTAAGPAAGGDRIDWRGARESWRAFARLPAAADAADSARIELYLSGVEDDDRVLLAGIERALMSAGALHRVTFELGELRRGAPPELPDGLLLLRADGRLDLGIPSAANQLEDTEPPPA